MALPYDVAIVGGGIIGLAVAHALQETHPGTSLILLEKEASLASHQTGHNSGVIHSGIYYRPGSLKAQCCVTGAQRLMEFCQAHDIPYAQCGKVIVATTDDEVAQLHQLLERAQANGVPGVAMIGPERLRELEPHARGCRALHVPSTGIVDFTAVAHAMGRELERRGGHIRYTTRVDGLTFTERAWRIETTSGEVQARALVTCGGLYADRLARMAGAPDDVRIIPFRGDYYDVRPARRSLVRTMVYPVPNSALPFLGVHLTRTIDGSVHAGPNAVLALKREGYRKTDLSVPEALDVAGYPGFWRLARRHWRVGLEEQWRAWSKRAFVRSAQRLVPELQPDDLTPGGSGVRAQAVDRAGRLLDDFEIAQGRQAIWVRNVPSPAATASLAIGRTVATMLTSIWS